MALIKWDDSFSVRVAEIDRQHQVLAKMSNDLNDAMRQGKGKEILGKIISELIGYTATHFKTEERYFAQFEYPDALDHKKEHSSFVQKVSEFKDGFQSGRLSLSIEVMNFLSDWLQNHIKKTDRKYSRFFNDKGLK